MRKISTLTSAALLGFVASHAATATTVNLVSDGDFEQPYNTTTHTFPSWSVNGTAAAGVATTPLDNTQSALINVNGILSQAFSNAVSQSTVTFLFAGTDPGTGRVANFYLNDSRTTGGGQLNFRVVEGSTDPTHLGTLQVYDAAGVTWRTVIANAVPFSSDLSTPTINQLKLDVTTGPLSYTATLLANVTVNNGTVSGGTSYTSSPLSYYQAAMSDIDKISFHADNTGSIGFVVDDVTVTPEPATLALLAIPGLLMLGRRRRQI